MGWSSPGFGSYGGICFIFYCISFLTSMFTLHGLHYNTPIEKNPFLLDITVQGALRPRYFFQVVCSWWAESLVFYVPFLSCINHCRGTLLQKWIGRKCSKDTSLAIVSTPLQGAGTEHPALEIKWASNGSCLIEVDKRQNTTNFPRRSRQSVRNSIWLLCVCAWRITPLVSVSSHNNGLRTRADNLPTCAKGTW